MDPDQNLTQLHGKFGPSGGPSSQIHSLSVNMVINAFYYKCASNICCVEDVHMMAWGSHAQFLHGDLGSRSTTSKYGSPECLFWPKLIKPDGEVCSKTPG